MTLRIGSLLFLLPLATTVLADDSALSLSDLEAYRVALSAKADHSAPILKFRDLWDHPETYAGHAVRVEGRVARVFRQPGVGEFPPLVEAWVKSPAGDPFCLVFPDNGAQMTPEVGTSVEFSGTFLRRLRYRGGDTDRVAPLIVGPEPPSISMSRSETTRVSWSTMDWTLGVGAVVVVGLILTRRHFSRPLSPPSTFEEPPLFLDGEEGNALEDD